MLGPALAAPQARRARAARARGRAGRGAGHAPGPRLGELLAELEEAQLRGRDRDARRRAQPGALAARLIAASAHARGGRDGLEVDVARHVALRVVVRRASCTRRTRRGPPSAARRAARSARPSRSRAAGRAAAAARAAPRSRPENRAAPRRSRSSRSCPRPRAGSAPASRGLEHDDARALADRAQRPVPAHPAAHALHERLLRAGRDEQHAHAARPAPRAAAARARAAPPPRSRLSLAPGTTVRVAMSKNASALPADSASPSLRSGRQGGPRARARRRRAASAAARCLALVPAGERVGDDPRSARAGRSGRRAPRRGGRRRRASPRASGSPASPTTFQVERCGSRRRKRCGPPETSSTIPAAASSPSAAVRAARRSAGQDARGRQQPERDGHRADRALLLDPRCDAERGQLAADPLRRPPLAVGGRGALE